MPDLKKELEVAKEKITELDQQITAFMRDGRRQFDESNANLYLALPGQTQPKGWFRKLANLLNVFHFLRLKPFGEPLDPIAQTALYFAAGILSAIFVIEFIGWTLMFNEVLNAGVLQWSYRTIPAIYFGLLFAFGIIALEQAILTADTTKGWGKRKGTLIIRILLIGCSALITTQPYELLFFSSEVKDRIHLESIRAEMGLRYEEYEKFAMTPVQIKPVVATTPSPEPSSTTRRRRSSFVAEADKLCPANVTDPPVPLRLPSEHPDVYEARVRQAGLEYYRRLRDSCAEALNLVPSRAKIVEQAREQAWRAYHDQECPSDLKEQECRSWSGRAYGLQLELKELDDAKARYELNAGALAALITRLENQGGVTGHPEEAAATAEDIRRRRTQLMQYMQDLALSKPGDERVLPGYRGAPDTHFHDAEYGITNKIRVLYSELSGLPYQWPTFGNELKTKIANEFSLHDPEPGAKWYRWFPWAMVLLAAMFLPFISLGYKFTLNENLNLYYVTEYQEQLGHVGATAATQAARQFWRSRGRTDQSQTRYAATPPKPPRAAPRSPEPATPEPPPPEPHYPPASSGGPEPPRSPEPAPPIELPPRSGDVIQPDLASRAEAAGMTEHNGRDHGAIALPPEVDGPRQLDEPRPYANHAAPGAGPSEFKWYKPGSSDGPTDI